MTRVDLDIAQAEYDRAGSITFVPSLIAELRAAREVIEASRDLLDEVTMDWHEPRELHRTLDAYDKVVG